MAFAGGVAAPSNIGPKAPAPRAPKVAAPKAPRAPKAAAPKAPTHVTKAATQRVGARPQASNASPPPVFNPIQGFLNNTQLAGLAKSMATSEANAALGPLRQQYSDIQGSSNTALQRYGSANQFATGQINQAAGQMGQQALTDENRVANLISGQNKATADTMDQIQKSAGGQAFGALDGGAREQIQNEIGRQQTENNGLGTAWSGLAGQTDQNARNLLTQMGSTNAMRGTEGAGNLAGFFGRELAKNSAQQTAANAKIPGRITQLETDLGQKQFADYANAQQLGIKRGTLANEVARTGVQQQNAATANFRAMTTAQHDAAMQQIASGRLSETNRHNLVTEGNAAEKLILEARKIAQSGQKARTLTPSENNLITGQINTAYNAIWYAQKYQKWNPTQIRRALQTGIKATKDHGALPQVKDPTIVNAAMAIQNGGKLSPALVSELQSYGYAIPQAWIK